MKDFKENIRFKAGIKILKIYESEPDIQDMGDEVYVGDMCKWEDSITESDIEDLEELGFEWHEGAECLAFCKQIEAKY